MSFNENNVINVFIMRNGQIQCFLCYRCEYYLTKTFSPSSTGQCRTLHGNKTLSHGYTDQTICHMQLMYVYITEGVNPPSPL